MPRRMELAVAYRLAARLMAASLQALIFLLLARNLDLAEMGVVVLGQAAGSVLGAILALGIPAYALRLRGVTASEGPERHQDILQREVVTLAVLYSSTGGILVFAFLSLSKVGSITLLMASSLAVAIELIGNALQALIAGSGRQYVAANVLILQRLVVLVPLGAVWMARGDMILGYCISNGVLFLVAVFLSIRIWGWTLALRNVLRSSLGYWASSINASLANLDLLIIRFTVGESAVGLYGVATRLVSPLSIVASSIVTVIVPSATIAGVEDSKRIFRRAYLAMFGFAGIGSILALPFAQIVVVILGDAYASSLEIIAAVVVGVCLSGISQVVVAENFVAGRPWLSAIGIGIGTLAGLLVFSIICTVGGIEFLWMGPIALQACVLLSLVVMRIRLKRSEARGDSRK